MSDFLEKWASESDKNKKICAREDLILDVTEDILIIMEDKGISKAELSRSLGKSRAYMSQILSGTRNMTLRTLSDISFYLDIKPTIQISNSENDLLNVNHSSHKWHSEVYTVNNAKNDILFNDFNEKVTFNISNEKVKEYG